MKAKFSRIVNPLSPGFRAGFSRMALVGRAPIAKRENPIWWFVKKGKKAPKL